MNYAYRIGIQHAPCGAEDVLQAKAGDHSFDRFSSGYAISHLTARCMATPPVLRTSPADLSAKLHALRMFMFFSIILAK